MKSNSFDPFDLISTIFVPSSLNLACDTNGSHEGAAMWHFFMKRQTAATLSSRIALRYQSPRKRQKEGALTIYCEEVNYLLKMYATSDVIAESDAEKVRFLHRLTRTLIEYTKLLWARVLRCNRVYNKYITIGNFIEGLQDAICKSMPSFGGLADMQLYEPWHHTQYTLPTSRMIYA